MFGPKRIKKSGSQQRQQPLRWLYHLAAASAKLRQNTWRNEKKEMKENEIMNSGNTTSQSINYVFHPNEPVFSLCFCIHLFFQCSMLMRLYCCIQHTPRIHKHKHVSHFLPVYFVDLFLSWSLTLARANIAVMRRKLPAALCAPRTKRQTKKTTNNKKRQQQQLSTKPKSKTMQQKESEMKKMHSENHSNGRTEAETTTMGFDFCRLHERVYVLCSRIVCLRCSGYAMQLRMSTSTQWATLAVTSHKQRAAASSNS